MRDDLAGLCRAMVDIPSVSHSEAALADFVVEHLSAVPGVGISRFGNNVVARVGPERSRTVIVAGHMDTVPPDGNELSQLRDGRIYGLGSADMKGGLAVMLGLAEEARNFACGVTFIFYACEEVASEFSGLLEIERNMPEVLRADVAVLMEPTAAHIEAGCQGTMRVRVEVKGTRAHTARPWMGKNAIHRLGAFISRASNAPLVNPMIDGLEFQESLQVVQVDGGVANNVVPDKATMILNYRFAPDKDVRSAFSFVSSLFEDFLEPDDVVEMEEGVPGALPSLVDPFVSNLLAASGRSPRAKLGWTDVAFFAGRGIPATNFGPGDPLLAHTRSEYVDVSEIDSVFGAMKVALGG